MWKPGDLAGKYYPLDNMEEKDRQQLVDDHFLFVSGDPNLKVMFFPIKILALHVCLSGKISLTTGPNVPQFVFENLMLIQVYKDLT